MWCTPNLHREFFYRSPKTVETRMQLEEHLVGFLHKDIGLSYQVFVPATDSNLTKRSTVVRRKLGNSEGTTWSERCEAGSGGGGGIPSEKVIVQGSESNVQILPSVVRPEFTRNLVGFSEKSRNRTKKVGYY